METNYGPTLKARERLSAEGRWQECREEIRAMAERHNEATDGGLLMHAEYMVAIGEEGVMSAALRVRLLGPLQVERDGQPGRPRRPGPAGAAGAAAARREPHGAGRAGSSRTSGARTRRRARRR